MVQRLIWKQFFEVLNLCSSMSITTSIIGGCFLWKKTNYKRLIFYSCFGFFVASCPLSSFPRSNPHIYGIAQLCLGAFWSPSIVFLLSSLSTMSSLEEPLGLDKLPNLSSIVQMRQFSVNGCRPRVDEMEMGNCLIEGRSCRSSNSCEYVFSVIFHL